VLRDQVHLAAGVFQQADFGIGQKLHQQVDVAIRLHSPVRGRSEYGLLTHPVPPAQIAQHALVDLHRTKLNLTSHRCSLHHAPSGPPRALECPLPICRALEGVRTIEGWEGAGSKAVADWTKCHSDEGLRSHVEEEHFGRHHILHSAGEVHRLLVPAGGQLAVRPLPKLRRFEYGSVVAPNSRRLLCSILPATAPTPWAPEKNLPFPYFDVGALAETPLFFAASVATHFQSLKVIDEANLLQFFLSHG
jgi:hypothetical protein